ncbi:TIGR02186 family protein [Mesorhizobium sp. M4B.F.Ca.ET.215.01.1.1]|uniref:TIGR02186 family protein n=1 Tax=unclassified Mesorhizobium TaxID=325217 RepID=UPI000FCB712D|nr:MULTISPECIES: TIGR02186 family protein [unclassified Mesorhizobium]RUW18323.1 TIGR02186 family protein [Mesorhizobium sp. M4B.F.Ca.ET.013.02.1.1]RUW74119.1 TIGR02186 family protein [Mesorhizobium sp. M4B.F.Ca.ET.049.02.1.2]RVD37169.1 TIGR02186 family protein [Mesorhizobium sp. M4B.F.Ca.ET.019.03.1.1]TGQ15140.1 TIGR02186 family protein [Mesorhizobium sp. M4B.F.Ca.ET.215.01.1.1]TGQ48653.1 TIGR02186 family protein [Mesorhizobium sp. M00.F.Ca.ET.220.01.1.1]
MAGRKGFAAAALLLLVAAASPTAAQTPPVEGIQIGLSTDAVSITAGFSGADLTIFGSLENPDPLVARQGRYDVIVVLEGPPRPVVVRRKDRVLGVWINLESETFENVPVSYSVATTRPLQDITEPNSYKQLSLGSANLYMKPADETDSPATIEEFTAALRDRKKATGLYSENVGGVQFLSQNLFRATVRLAPDVPVGTHKARAFLFKSGMFIKESSAQLEIRKSGFEQSIFRVAHDYSFLYGVFAVSLAMLTGWLGRLVFRKD